MQCRRRDLLVSGAIFSPLISGCLDFGNIESNNGDPEVSMEYIDVINFYNNVVNVEVRVQRDDQRVYRQNLEIKASNDREAGGQRLTRAWMNKSGDYRVFAKLTSDEEWEKTPWTTEMYDADDLPDDPCFNPSIVIREDGVLGIRVGIGSCSG